MTKKRRTYRKFLNKKEGLAAVQWEVSRDWAEFTMTDCQRQVELSFSFASDDDRRDAYHKLRELRKALDTFEAECRRRWSELEKK